MGILKGWFVRSLYYLYNSRARKYLARFFWFIADSRSGTVRGIALRLRDYNIRVILDHLKLRTNTESIQDFNTNQDENGKERLGRSRILSAPSSNDPFDERVYPKISIITPNLNQGSFLEECIKSILSQDYPNLEFIIIDGGSTDNSVEIIRKYEKILKYWVSEKDNGQADAINKGLRHATGEVFNWLNSDDRFEAGALFEVADAYRKDPSAAGWVGGCHIVDMKGNVIRTTYPNGLDRENIGQNWAGTQFYQPSCFLSIEKIKEVGGLNPDLYIALDLDLWIRILEKGRFITGKGLWSQAIEHEDAKTQKCLEIMWEETINLQRKYAFFEGADNRTKDGINQAIRYCMPGVLRDRMAKARESLAPWKSGFRDTHDVTIFSMYLPQVMNSLSCSLMHNILKLLTANNCNVNYIYMAKKPGDSQDMTAFDGKINFTFLPSKEAFLQMMIDQNNTEVVWISDLLPINDLSFIAHLCRTLKTKKTDIKLVMNWMKSPFVDEFTEKEILSLYELADTVVVSSVKDKKQAEEGVEGKIDVQIIPNTYEIIGSSPSFEERKDICFIGDFDSKEDTDAVVYFLKDILGLILRSNWICFHVLGRHSEKLAKRFDLHKVTFMELPANMGEILSKYRLFVCPMTQSGGMEGKVGIAAGAGLPIVTTSIGAEGFPIKDGDECFIADSPTEFAEKCIQIVSDPITWSNFSTKSTLMVEENFSMHAVSEKIQKILGR